MMWTTTRWQPHNAGHIWNVHHYIFGWRGLLTSYHNTSKVCGIFLLILCLHPRSICISIHNFFTFKNSCTIMTQQTTSQITEMCASKLISASYTLPGWADTVGVPSGDAFWNTQKGSQVSIIRYNTKCFSRVNNSCPWKEAVQTTASHFKMTEVSELQHRKHIPLVTANLTILTIFPLHGHMFVTRHSLYWVLNLLNSLLLVTTNS
jgi:hypothetical protein